MSIADRSLQARSILDKAAILPVITIETLDQARHLSDALSDGGLTVLELTLRTPIALDAIALLKKERPKLIVGAGTVMSASQIKQACDAGADFLVTPGTPLHLAEQLAQIDCPVIPGAATPTELMALQAFGFTVCKLFPAAAVGGIQMIKALAGPLPDLTLCPTGGISEQTAIEYLKLPNVTCVGGSWMVQKQWIEQQDWAAIRTRTAQAIELITKARSHRTTSINGSTHPNQ